MSDMCPPPSRETYLRPRDEPAIMLVERSGQGLLYLRQAMKNIGLRLSGTCGEHRIPVRALQIHEFSPRPSPSTSSLST